MEVELAEIRDFLNSYPPFDQLGDECLDTLPGKLQVSYARRDTEIFPIGASNVRFYILRSGAVEVLDGDGVLHDRLDEGGFFGFRTLMARSTSHYRVVSIEDTLLYSMEADTFNQLLEVYPDFKQFFVEYGAARLRRAVSNRQQQDSLRMSTQEIGALLKREPVCVTCDVSIIQAAQTMSTERVSSLLVLDDGKLSGIVTDRDLRGRVVAQGMDFNRPVCDVMTSKPLSISSSSVAHEAMLMMIRNNVHHLPVVDGMGKAVGMLTTSDLVRQQSDNPVYLVGDIYKQNSLEELKSASQGLKPMLANLVNLDTPANSVGRIVTSIGSAVTRRLLQLGEEKLGPAPVPYAWVAAGSQARREQTGHSDQDNCMILSDDYDPQRHGEYFKALAQFVCDGLNECGYVYCPGGIMAITDRWRQPFRVWKEYFNNWITEPDPSALMHLSIFFDLRCLYGDAEMLEQLKEHYLQQTSTNKIFLSYLATNCLSHQPPLGFFRQFVLINGGEHDHTFDLKHRGVVPIIDLARLHTLAAGLAPINTFERLELAGQHGQMSAETADDTLHAFEFISDLRLKHQARQIQKGEEPDNYVSPDDLSHFERHHLKDAFRVVADMQDVLEKRYQTGRF